MTALRLPGDRSFEEILAGYSDDLLQKTVQRACRFSQAKKETDPAKRLTRLLSTKRSLNKLVEELEENERIALSLFVRTPTMHWRWDQCMRMLQILGHESPYRAVQGLLAEGLLCMFHPGPHEPLVRFEIADSAPIEALPLVKLSSPINPGDLELPLPTQPLSGSPASRWRQCDGWEFPLRLAVLWRLASLTPIKRTQQNKLFKRDQERILRNPLVTSPLLDCPENIEDLGNFIYQLAQSQGWLDNRSDEQEPVGTLGEVWPTELPELLLMCGRDLLLIEHWNELGAETPVGSFSQQVAPARVLLLMLLGTLPPETGASVDQLAEVLTQCCPPFNGEGELFGVLRHAEARAELARRWVRISLGGPLYQCGLVKLDGTGSLYALTELGRNLLGEPVEIPPFPTYPQTLLAQPNHELIVYRQGLSIPLLGELIQFAEPKSLGAALTFEVNADSIYHGLETGITAKRIVQTLQEHGGREIPPALADSIRTWSQRRDQLTLYSNGSLYEFSNGKDLEDAVARGLTGDRISETLLLVAGDADKAVKHLRITASRDYRFPAQKCATTQPDGVTLRVDTTKSDLMLDAELRRFAEPLSTSDGLGEKTYLITASSMASALDQGLGIDYIEKWFRDRTGDPPPPSVMLLFRAANGAGLSARHRLVVQTESPLLADGLLQHPATAALFDERLGPTSLSVSQDHVSELRDALTNLGIDFDIQS